MAPQVKDLVLSLLWLRSLVWHGFDPWPGKLHMLQARPQGKKEEKGGRQNLYWTVQARRLACLGGSVPGLSGHRPAFAR